MGEKMKREEQIIQAALDDCAEHLLDYKWSFMHGAKWADEHPKEGLVSIDKACEWLTKHAKKYYFNKERYLGTEELVEDFKISMKM